MNCSMKIFANCCFVAMLFCVNLAHATQPISLEVKVFDTTVAFVFHHSKNQVLDIKSNNNFVSASISAPTAFEISNLNEFNKLAKNLNISKDKKHITFVTKTDLKSKSIIYGEKLTAIEFTKNEKEESAQVEQKLPEPEITIHEDTTLSKEPLLKYVVSKKGVPSLVFNKSMSTAQAAVFFRDHYLWVIFNKPQQFTFANNNVISDLTQIKYDQATILRFKVKDYNNAKFDKSEHNIILTLRKGNFRNNDKSIQPLNVANEPDQEGMKILGNFSNTTVVEFYDPELGDLIKVVTSDIPGIRLDQHKEAIGFKTVPSIIGIVFGINSDDVDFTKNKDHLSIISKHNLLAPTVLENKERYLKFKLDNNSTITTLLPVLDKKLDIINFNTNKNRLLMDASMADSANKYTKRYELAKFYFIQELYEESLIVLSLMKSSNAKEYNAALAPQFQTAVVNTLVGDLNEAKTIYSYLLKNTDSTTSSEINLWNNYNEFLIGNNPIKIGVIDNLNKAVKYYPDNMYWPIVLAEIELALLENDLKLVDVIFKDLRTPVGKFANSLNYYKAEYYKKNGQIHLTQQLLQDLTKRDCDAFNKVRAEMDLVKLQLSRKEITRDVAIQRLNAVRFDWRGDTLEYNLLMLLAAYYSTNNDIFNALRTYHYIQSVFYNKLSNFYITSEMVKIFNDIFLPGGVADKMDDFNVVSLFYEFKELTPIGTDGDKVILEIAKRLVKLDLLDNATELLSHQIKYRLNDEERVQTADDLAVILLLNKKPTEAIKILDVTDKYNFKFDEYHYRTMLRAKALIDLQKYTEALTYLKNDYSVDALVLKKECLFQAKNWQGYIALVEPEIMSAEKIEGPLAQDTLRLAVAYYMVNDQSKLQELLDFLQNTHNETLKGVVDLLLVSGNPIDYHNLDASLNINQMQRLLDKYKKSFLDQKGL